MALPHTAGIYPQFHRVPVSVLSMLRSSPLICLQDTSRFAISGRKKIYDMLADLHTVRTFQQERKIKAAIITCAKEEKLLLAITMHCTSDAINAQAKTRLFEHIYRNCWWIKLFATDCEVCVYVCVCVRACVRACVCMSAHTIIHMPPSSPQAHFKRQPAPVFRQSPN